MDSRILSYNKKYWAVRYSASGDFYSAKRISLAMHIAELFNLNIPKYAVKPLKIDDNENFKEIKVQAFFAEYLNSSEQSKSKNANKLLGDKYKIKSDVESTNLHSYLELAEFIIKKGYSSDLEELWKRMLVNICIKNKDDNFYTHTFIQNENNWKLLGPYFLSFSCDCDTQNKGLSLNIDDKSNKFNLDLAISVRKFFKISKDKAREHLENILKIINSEEIEKHLMDLEAMSKKRLEELKAELKVVIATLSKKSKVSLSKKQKAKRALRLNIIKRLTPLKGQAKPHKLRKLIHKKLPRQLNNKKS